MRIAIIDDHPIVCQDISSILKHEADFDVVASVSNGKDAEQKLVGLAPDLILVDLRLPGESGFDIVERLKPLIPNTKFVVFSTFSTVDDVQRAIAVGIDGYILKETLPEELISALRLVGQGRPYIDPSIMEIVIQWQKRTVDPLTSLTPREREVLGSLSRGLSNRQIGKDLYISEYTVKKHVSSILAKLGLEDRTQAALYAVANEVGNGKQRHQSPA